MNIRFLETVIWLAHYRNFRVTAEHLHITQAAISSRISVIEQEVGVRLFERLPREVKVTPEGLAFLEEAREIVQRYNAMMKRYRSPMDMSGPVRLALTSSMAHLLLPEITRTLRERHPDVKLEVITDDTSEKLTNLLPAHKIDACCTAHPLELHAALESLPLCTLPMAWVASPLLVPASNESYSIEDLARLPLITYAEDTFNAQRLKAYFGSSFADIRHLISSNALATSLQMAIAGVGAAVLPKAIIQHELAEGSLHQLTAETPFPPTTYRAVWLPGKNSAHAAVIARLAQDAARQLAHTASPEVIQSTV